MGGVVLLPCLEELRDDDGQGAADDRADLFGDGEDKEDRHTVWRVARVSSSSESSEEAKRCLTTWVGLVVCVDFQIHDSSELEQAGAACGDPNVSIALQR